MTSVVVQVSLADDRKFFVAIDSSQLTTEAVCNHVCQKLDIPEGWRDRFGMFLRTPHYDIALPPNSGIPSIMSQETLKSTRNVSSTCRLLFKWKNVSLDAIEDDTLRHLAYIQCVDDFLHMRCVENIDAVVPLAAVRVLQLFGVHKDGVHTTGFLRPRVKEFVPKEFLDRMTLEKWESSILWEHETTSATEDVKSSSDVCALAERMFLEMMHQVSSKKWPSDISSVGDFQRLITQEEFEEFAGKLSCIGDLGQQSKKNWVPSLTLDIMYKDCPLFFERFQFSLAKGFATFPGWSIRWNHVDASSEDVSQVSGSVNEKEVASVSYLPPDMMIFTARTRFRHIDTAVPEHLVIKFDSQEETSVWITVVENVFELPPMTMLSRDVLKVGAKSTQGESEE